MLHKQNFMTEGGNDGTLAMNKWKLDQVRGGHIVTGLVEGENLLDFSESSGLARENENTDDREEMWIPARNQNEQIRSFQTKRSTLLEQLDVNPSLTGPQKRLLLDVCRLCENVFPAGMERLGH